MGNRMTSVSFPVFHGYEVRVILAKDVAATGRRLRNDLSNACGGLVTKDEHPMRCWLVLETKAEPSTVAHEAYHAVKEMFRAMGTGDDEEMFAYHLGHLVGRIHKFMKRNKR